MKSPVFKKTLSVILAVATLMSCCGFAMLASYAKSKSDDDKIQAEDGEEVLYDGDFCYILKGKDAVVVGYIGKGGDVVVPEKLGGHTAKSIRRNVFLEDDNIITVHLSAQMEDISSEQFCLCSNLKSITVDEKNKVYTSVDGVLYKDGGKTIALHPAANSTEYDIPSGVTKIGAYSFFTNKKLARVTIPSTVKEIGRNAFYNCELVREIFIPDSVKKVGAGAFSWCSNLKELHVPAKLSDIGRRAFFPTYATTHSESDFVILGDSVLVAYLGGPYHVEIPEGVKKIADVFYADEEVESVTIPSTVTSISDRAFYGCTALESVTVPNSVKEIGDWAFYGCSKLTKVNIPDGAKILSYAFGACEKLKKAKINTEKIGEGAFEYCLRLSSVKLGKKVREIDKYAFYACEELDELKLPSRLQTIGVSALRRTKIKELKVGYSVTDIGKYAFADNEGIVLTVTEGSYAEKYAKDNGISIKTIKKTEADKKIEEEDDYYSSDFFEDYGLYVIIGGAVLVVGAVVTVILTVLHKKRKRRSAISEPEPEAEADAPTRSDELSE